MQKRMRDHSTSSVNRAAKNKNSSHHDFKWLGGRPQGTQAVEQGKDLDDWRSTPPLQGRIKGTIVSNSQKNLHDCLEYISSVYGPEILRASQFDGH
jgi:hypothetical protein